MEPTVYDLNGGSIQITVFTSEEMNDCDRSAKLFFFPSSLTLILKGGYSSEPIRWTR